MNPSEAFLHIAKAYENRSELVKSVWGHISICGAIVRLLWNGEITLETSEIMDDWVKGDRVIRKKGRHTRKWFFCNTDSFESLLLRADYCRYSSYAWRRE